MYEGEKDKNGAPSSSWAPRSRHNRSAFSICVVAHEILKNVGSVYLFTHAPLPASSNLVGNEYNYYILSEKISLHFEFKKLNADRQSNLNSR
jgi:hypothetical protein